MADNEHTAAALGHSEKLCIEHAISDGVEAAPDEAGVSPARARNCRYSSGKASKQDCKVSPVIGAEKSGDVLNDHPLWLSADNKAMELVPEAGSLSSQSLTLSSHG